MNAHQTFCPNPTCPSSGVAGQGNICIHSWTQRRYRCRVCGKSFSATKGTALYRLRYEGQFVAQVLTLLAFGCPPAAIVAAFELDARTVASWQRKAGAHCQKVHQEQVLATSLDLGQVQADEVRVRLQGRQVLWMAMAICVPFRLWLGGLSSARRDRHLIEALAKMVHSCARFAAPILLVSDGLRAYVRAWKKTFRTPLHTGRRGRPALISWPEVVIGQVIKVKQQGRVVGIVQSVVQGSLEQVLKLLPERQGLSTAYIERLNATFRARLCPLVRRGRALARKAETLERGMFLVGCVYNFCTAHQSLEGKTPAMAAGLTDHCWSVEELLGFKVAPPPPPPQVPKRRYRRCRQDQRQGWELCTV